MFKKYFEGINGIEIYPVFLLIIFVLFFVSMSVWLMRANKKTMEEMGKLPLADNNDQTEKS
jgi:cytochrome c oxidase cbb3-type subunit 3